MLEEVIKKLDDSYTLKLTKEMIDIPSARARMHGTSISRKTVLKH